MNIDTSALKEALQARYGEMAPPAPTDTMSQPRGVLPTGGSNVPTQQPPQPQAPQGSQNVGRKPAAGVKDPKAEANKIMKGAMNALNDNFDADTQMQAKVLIAKLLQHA